MTYDVQVIDHAMLAIVGVILVGSLIATVIKVGTLIGRVILTGHCRSRRVGSLLNSIQMPHGGKAELPVIVNPVHKALSSRQAARFLKEEISIH